MTLEEIEALEKKSHSAEWQRVDGSVYRHDMALLIAEVKRLREELRQCKIAADYEYYRNKEI